MLRYFSILLLIILFSALETAVFPNLSVFGVSPDLLLILVVVWGMLRGGREGALLGLFVGACQDVLSSTLYFHMVSKCLIGFGSGIFVSNLSGAGSYVSVVMVSLMTALSYVIEGVLLYFFLGYPVPPVSGIFIAAILSVLYNGLLTPILYPVIEMFSMRFGSTEAQESFSGL